VIRLLIGLTIICVSIWLGYTAVCSGVSRTILRHEPDYENLKFASSISPDDSLIQEALALTHLYDPEHTDIGSAEKIIRRATHNTPQDYKLWISRARIEEQAGNPTGAADSLIRAISLAPHHFEPYWMLANLRLRSRNLKKAVETFRQALSINPDQIPYTLELLWQVTEGDRDTIKQALPDTGWAKSEWAWFLISKGYLKDALVQWSFLPEEIKIERKEITTELLSRLLDAEEYGLAWDVWLHLPDRSSRKPEKFKIQNGKFESPVRKGLTGFDWGYTPYPEVKLQRDRGPDPNSYSINIVYQAAGNRSFEHLKQVILVEPNRRYYLDYKLRVSGLVSAEPPKILIVDLNDTAKTVLLSISMPTGSFQWSAFEYLFKTGPQTRAILLSIRRDSDCKNEFCPIFGSLWLSQVGLREEGRWVEEPKLH